MFDIGYSELLLIAVVALVVIGPKDLPNVMRTVGNWVGQARGMARHFRSGIDTMIREAELEEMEKKWREENERIMRDHPVSGSWDEPPALPQPDAPSLFPPDELPLSGPDASPTLPFPEQALGDQAPARPDQPPHAPPAGEDDRRELP
jgi:sec-independent protein translocase protein TatB